MLFMRCVYHIVVLQQGGHFAAWEQPELLYQDVMAFVDNVKL
jgi:hypothetical protein